MFHFSKFPYNSVNVCRQVGIFHTNYRQPQQSTSNKKQSQAGLWFSTLLLTIFKLTNTQPLVRGIHTFLLSDWRLQGGCQVVYRPVWLRALLKRQVYIFPFNLTEKTKFILSELKWTWLCGLLGVNLDLSGCQNMINCTELDMSAFIILTVRVTENNKNQHSPPLISKSMSV